MDQRAEARSFWFIASDVPMRISSCTPSRSIGQPVSGSSVSSSLGKREDRERTLLAGSEVGHSPVIVDGVFHHLHRVRGQIHFFSVEKGLHDGDHGFFFFGKVCVIASLSFVLPFAEIEELDVDEGIVTSPCSAVCSPFYTLSVSLLCRPCFTVTTFSAVIPFVQAVLLRTLLRALIAEYRCNSV